jgi:hypothetical protein
MRNWHTNHPDPDELIRYSNGELPPRQSARVARHVENCWACRTEIEDTTAVIGRYVHYRRSVLHPSIPPPPRDWQDLSGEFARIRSEQRRGVQSIWPAKWISLLRPRLAPAVAAVAALTVASLLYLGRAPSVRAAELIERAIRQERMMPQTATAGPMIRVKTRQGRFTRRRDLSATGAGLVAASGDVGLASGLEVRFASAHYSWLKPLNATSFSEWRNELPDKQDVVSTSRDENAQDLVAVETSTATGTLGKVTLFFRKSDLHPIRGEFRFRNGEEVEMSEIAAATQVAAPIQPPRLTRSAPPTEHASTERGTNVRVGSAEELHVLAALHRIGADLGDPLNVDREQSQIVVSGVGIKQQRRAEIERVLRPLPHVVVEFSEPQRVSPTDQSVYPLTEQSAPSTFGRKIEQQIGGPAATEAFSNTLLRLSEELLVRAHALHQLGERFPVGVETQFGAEEKGLLHQIRLDHERAVTRTTDQIKNSLSPILVKLGVSARVPESSNQESWQLAAQNVLAAAQRFDRILATTLAPTAAMEDESAELGNALGALHAAVAPFRADRR